MMGPFTDTGKMQGLRYESLCLSLSEDSGIRLKDVAELIGMGIFKQEA